MRAEHTKGCCRICDDHGKDIHKLSCMGHEIFIWHASHMALAWRAVLDSDAGEMLARTDGLRMVVPLAHVSLLGTRGLDGALWHAGSFACGYFRVSSATFWKSATLSESGWPRAPAASGKR